jgi:thymidine kinase
MIGLGSIEAILGGMYAGKTSDLNKRIENAIIAGIPTLCIKHAKDTRSGSLKLNASHDGRKLSNFVATDNLAALCVPDDIKCIFIDEAQFFEPAEMLLTFCLTQKRAGRRVTFAALSSTYKGDPWPGIQAVVPAHQDSLTVHYAVCAMCARDASYSRRIDANEQQLISIGGDEKYIPTCLEHLTEPVQVDPSIIQRRLEALAKLKRITNH